MSLSLRRSLRRLAPGWLFLAVGSGALAEELWVPPTHSAISSIPPALDVTWPVTSAGLAAFGFSIPDDMASFAAARVVILPSSGESGTYSVFAEVKRDGEIVSPFDIQAQQNLPLTLTNDEITEVDISSVFTGLFDASSGGRDYVSLLFYAPIPSARVLGLRFVYQPSPIGNASLSPDAVDSSKIVDGGITGADIANGSIRNAHVAANAIDGSKIADSSISSADVLNGSLTGLDIQDLTLTNSDISNLAGIAVAKIFGDAGVELLDVGDVTGVSTTMQNLGMVSVTAPGPGFVILWLSGWAVTFGDNTVVELGFGSTSTVLDLGYSRAGTLDGSGTERAAHSLSLTRVQPVAAGTTHFFVNAVKPAVFASNLVNLGNVFAAALFVPKRY